MKLSLKLSSILLAGLAACSGSRVDADAAHGAEAPPLPLGQVVALAGEHDLVLDVPQYERTPAALAEAVQTAIGKAEWELDRFATQDRGTLTFASTFAALDTVVYPVLNVANRVSLLKEASDDAALRAAATEQAEVLNRWFVALQYRDDVYQACKAFADLYDAGEPPRLSGEDLKLFEDTMRDYRRAGLNLDEETRTLVAELRNRLNTLETEFDTNINQAGQTLYFTAQELTGVPQAFLDRTARGPEGGFAVRPHVTVDYLTVMENATSESTRRRLCQARYALAMEANGPVLEEMVRLRDWIAEQLGYDSWADYQTEPRMAGSAARAVRFAEDLARGLQPKFAAEIEEFRAMKAEETGDPAAQVNIWDFRYSMRQLAKQRYQIDSEALRRFFELDRVLAGMFDIYEEIFGLRFRRVGTANVWAQGVTLWLASDAASGEPLGLFYLDMFPREGKYNHFAQFDIVQGKDLGAGGYRRPVVALICNFTPPGPDVPSLLNHVEVETLFHEFGHCLHNLVTEARFVNFSGANVPRDFVEAPSQMLEAWVWDPAVLSRFAFDYQDPDEGIDPAVIERMREADLATRGTFYRRQLAFALADLRMHLEGRDKDPAEIANQTMAEVFFAPPPGSSFSAYWGHLTGYDAGYYGYAWADAIAADLASVFEAAPGRFLDRETGMRLRREIYAVGGSRDVNESIRRFLGREPTNDAFMRALGIAQP